MPSCRRGLPHPGKLTRRQLCIYTIQVSMYSLRFPLLLRIFHSAAFARRLRLLVCLSLACRWCFFPVAALPQTQPPSAAFSKLSRQAGEARDADRLDEAAALYTKALALQPKWI